MQEQARFHSVLYDRGDLEDNVMKEIPGANIKFAHRHFQLSFKISPVFCIRPINDWTFREYPKVCVNLQTGVRYNYSVWRFLLWQEEKVTHHRKQQCAK